MGGESKLKLFEEKAWLKKDSWVAPKEKQNTMFAERCTT